jgi:hypothetical protein
LEKLPLPNRKGGSWHSGAILCGIVLVLRPLALAKDGRSSPCFRLSWGRFIGIGSLGELIGAGEGIDMREMSLGVRSGVGDCNGTSAVQKGISCGNGDMSMSRSIESFAPGEEDWIGGVVRCPSLCQLRESPGAANILLTLTLMRIQGRGEKRPPRSR